MTDFEDPFEDEEPDQPDDDGSSDDFDSSDWDDGVDPRLRGFVQSANEEHTEKGLPITLMCGGLVLSGYLISYSQYLRKEISVYVEPGDISEENIEFLGQYKAALAESETLSSLSSLVGGKAEIPRFVHLVDVTVVHSTLFELPLWRGRLDTVDGWTFGKLNAK